MFLFICTYYFPIVHLNMIYTLECCVCSLIDLEGNIRVCVLSSIILLLSSTPPQSKTKTIEGFKKKRMIDVLGGNLS